jgi:uncharacterized membrane protein
MSGAAARARNTGLEYDAAALNEVQTIQLAPNCSLQPRAAAAFFVTICLVSFSIAGYFALHGLWPIFPFAGLEMLVLGWALHTSLRRRHCLETITISEQRVEVEHRDGPHCRQVVFPRHWAQVKLRPAGSRLHPSRLTLESHGRVYEVGKFLTEQERRALAGRLMRSVGRVNESPPLSGANEGLRPRQ